MHSQPAICHKLLNVDWWSWDLAGKSSGHETLLYMYIYNAGDSGCLHFGIDQLSQLQYTVLHCKIDL